MRNRELPAVALSAALLLFHVEQARSETMSGALASAYLASPELNQKRAATRAIDEDVSEAKAGYRPHVRGAASFGYTGTDAANGRLIDTKSGSSSPSTGRTTVTQTLFDGNRTMLDVKRAESKVFQAREELRNTEQQVLLAGARVYMDVLRDTALLGLAKNDVALLIVRLREARARLAVGEVTPTDVAQVASYLATARSSYFTAQGTLMTSIAAYRRVLGAQPRQLDAARPLDALIPTTLDRAIQLAMVEHPIIHAALHKVDVAALQVQRAESGLYPTLDAVGRIEQLNEEHGNPRRSYFAGRLGGEVKVPFYTGGDVYSAVREAKERLTQARLEAAANGDAVRAQVVSAWGHLEASKAEIASTEAAVKASERAFIDVREEAKLGQRTTLDVLKAIQTLLQARIQLIGAQRERVVATYTIMAAVGRLSASNLGLQVEPYDPSVHLDQVKDKWIGLRTPDGR